MTDEMHQGQAAKIAWGQQVAGQRIQADPRQELLSRAALQARPHLASFAASAAAAGVPTVPYVVTTNGSNCVGAIDGWPLNPGRHQRVVTRDGYLVEAAQEVLGTVGRQSIAGRVRVVRAPDGTLQATSAAYTQSTDELVAQLRDWLGRTGVPLVPVMGGSSETGWALTVAKTRSQAAAFAVRLAALALFTVLYVAVTWVASSFGDQHTSDKVVETSMRVAFSLSVVVVPWLLYQSKMSFGRRAIRIQPGVQVYVCATCGRFNPIRSAAQLCSSCHRPLDNSPVQVVDVSQLNSLADVLG